jgi:hypothetical protein
MQADSCLAACTADTNIEFATSLVDRFVRGPSPRSPDQPNATLPLVTKEHFIAPDLNPFVLGLPP